MWRGKCSCLSHKPQEHGDLALDVDLSIDVPYVGLDGAGLDAQMPGDVAVSQALADEFCYLPLARRQLVSALHVRPLFPVKEKNVGFLEAHLIFDEMFTCGHWHLRHG